jgi:hypothetical protein
VYSSSPSPSPVNKNAPSNFTAASDESAVGTAPPSKPQRRLTTREQTSETSRPSAVSMMMQSSAPQETSNRGDVTYSSSQSNQSRESREENPSPSLKSRSQAHRSQAYLGDAAMKNTSISPSESPQRLRAPSSRAKIPMPSTSRVAVRSSLSPKADQSSVNDCAPPLAPTSVPANDILTIPAISVDPTPPLPSTPCIPLQNIDAVVASKF